MELRKSYFVASDSSSLTVASRLQGVAVNRICIQTTSSSCTNSIFDSSYAFSRNSTGVGFNQQAPVLERLIRDSNLMIKLAAKLPYHPQKDLEIDDFLSKFEGDLSKSKPIGKKYGEK